MKLTAFVAGSFVFQLTSLVVLGSVSALPIISANNDHDQYDHNAGLKERNNSNSTTTKKAKRDIDIEAAQLALGEGYEYPNLFDEAMPMIWGEYFLYCIASCE